MLLDDILESLKGVEGCLAATIFDIKGDVLIKHNNSQDIDTNAKAIISTVKTINKAGVGKCHFVQITSEVGIFGATWLVENESIAIVLLDSKSNIGLVKLVLAKIGKTEKKKKLASFFTN